MKRALIIASLMAAAGIASAQTTAVPATDPAVSGQASTQTPAGVPNPSQRPDKTMPNTRANVHSEAVVHNKTPANSNTPGGEATTTRNHQPNATDRVSEMSRGAVRQDAVPAKPRFGQKGERPVVPTNPTDVTGTPK